MPIQPTLVYDMTAGGALARRVLAETDQGGPRTVRALEEAGRGGRKHPPRGRDAGLERTQAEAAEPVTQAGVAAAVSQSETRLTWRLVYVAAIVVAAIKVIPSL